MTDIFKDFWDELEETENNLFKEQQGIVEDNYIALSSVISFFYLRNMKNNTINYSTFMSKADNTEKKYVKTILNANGGSKLYKVSDIKGSKINVLSLAINLTEENNSNGRSKQLEKHFKELSKKVEAYIKREYDIRADGTIKVPDVYDNQLTNGQKVSYKLIEDVKNGIIKGDRYEDIVEKASDWYSKRSMSDIKKIVRTEGTAITNEVGLEMFQEEGYKKYIYSSVIDSRTTEICRELDSMEFDISKAERGVNFPPMHVNCRSGFEIKLESK